MGDLRFRWLFVGLSVVFALACQPESQPEVSVTPTASAGAAVTPGPTVTPIPMLQAPFTPDQIREEWVAGLHLRLRRMTPDGQGEERWRVVEADADGCSIEFATFDDGGELTSKVVRRSSWRQLRDHSVWPRAIAKRERGSHESRFGALEGWWYEVFNDASETTTRLFFADDMPGAPVWLQQTRDGEPVMELEQIERGVEEMTP